MLDANTGGSHGGARNLCMFYTILVSFDLFEYGIGRMM